MKKTCETLKCSLAIKNKNQIQTITTNLKLGKLFSKKLIPNIKISSNQSKLSSFSPSIKITNNFVTPNKSPSKSPIKSPNKMGMILNLNQTPQRMTTEINISEYKVVDKKGSMSTITFKVRLIN